MRDLNVNPGITAWDMPRSVDERGAPAAEILGRLAEANRRPSRLQGILGIFCGNISAL